jgi:Fanconi anemia group M protein
MSNSKPEKNIYSVDNEFLKGEKLELRKYQLMIAQDCMAKNSLVVLPTGLGKTIIGVLIAAKMLKISPTNSKIIVLAPTRPLINQHYETFLNFLAIPEEKFCVLTGKISPKERPTKFLGHQILFFTPQTLRNDIASEKYRLEDVCLIIFDEAHHASGDYPYTMLAEVYIEQNPDGTILALTASPGSSKEKINELCKNLFIPSDNIHIRIRKDRDVKKYLKPMDIYKIGVNLTSLMEDIRKIIYHLLEGRLQYLSRLGFLKISSLPLYKKVIRKDLLELNRKLVAIVSGEGEKTGAYKGLSVNAQGLILFHMLELVEQQGLDVLLKYLDKLKKDAHKTNSSKANRILASDDRIRKMHLELRKRNEYNPKSLIHPKFLVLKKILQDELDKKPQSRILVFVKLRASVKNITERFKSVDRIKAVRFVGQATKSKNDKGLSQTQQLEILQKFKNGEYNVLISTNVAEEGLDIAECDLVVFYDIVASEIRLIQRKGRTARHREGRVILLYCRNTNDEIYLQIALSRLKRMQTNLKKSTSPYQNYQNDSKQSNLGKFFASHSKQKDKPQDSQVNTNIKGKEKKQLKTALYLNQFHDSSEKRSSLKRKTAILMSSRLPMKFGIRKRLKRADIGFEIKQTDFHITLYNRILLQIFEPREFLAAKLQSIYKNLKDRFELIIFIFDFTEFHESFDDEKRLFKKKILDFAVGKKFQLIPVDIPDELFFIIKNIYQHNGIKEEINND